MGIRPERLISWQRSLAEIASDHYSPAALARDIAMCEFCNDVSRNHPATHTTRRRFLAISGAAALGLALPGKGFAQKAPPKPQNVVSPDDALKLLMSGNKRYVSGVSRRHDFKHEREALAKGQNPYAGILSCADSRIAPEYAFDTGRGDLFVCRVAGNFANDDVIASFEYAVSVLNTPLLMVLGHQACGAVDATIKSIKDGTTLPGHLPSLVAAIGPAVKATLSQPGDALDNAIKKNVMLNVEKLKTATPIIDKAITDKKVRIVGAVYNLKSGGIDLLS
jgi:carbonic anhydrase